MPDQPRYGVLIANVGTADSPEVEDIREFLRQMLSDRRIVDLPRALWMPILHLFILPNRPKRTVERYRRIWTPQGSPLLVTCREQRSRLEAELARRGLDVPVALGMRYCNPSLGAALDELIAAGCNRVVLLPLFPQKADVTTVTCHEETLRQAKLRPAIESVGLIPFYCNRSEYLQALASSVADRWTWRPGSRILFTFHSTLLADIERGDPYYQQTLDTAGGCARLLGIPEGGWGVAYHSRFDNRRWLRPPAKEVLAQWAQEGVRDVAVAAPVFTADCIETLIDCDVEQRELFLRLCEQHHPDAGPASFTYIPTLGARADHVSVLADAVEDYLRGEGVCGTLANGETD